MNQKDKAQSSLSLTPLGILRNAIKAVPAVKFALGVAGIAAAVALIAGLITDLRVAVFGIIIMFGLMAVLVVFSNLVRIASRDLKLSAKLLAWASVLLTIATSFFMFTGFFFNWPRPLPGWLPSPPPPKTAVKITSPRHGQKVIVFISEQGGSWLEVKGIIENASSGKDLRIYVFSQSGEPEVIGWWYHGFADPKEDGEWIVPQVPLGRVMDKVVEGKRYRIQAVVASKDLQKTIENLSNKAIPDPKLFHPLDSATVNIIVGYASKE